MDRFVDLYYKILDIIYHGEERKYGFQFDRRDYLKKIGEVDKVQFQMNKENTERIKKLEKELNKSGFVLKKMVDANNSSSKLNVQIIGIENLFSVFFSNITDYYIFKEPKIGLPNAGKLTYLSWIIYNLSHHQKDLDTLNKNMLKIKEINFLEIDVSVFYLQLFNLIYSKLLNYKKTQHIDIPNILSNLLVNRQLSLNSGVLREINVNGVNYRDRFRELNETEKNLITKIYSSLHTPVFKKLINGETVNFVENDELRKILIDGLNEYITLLIEQLNTTLEFLTNFGTINIKDYKDAVEQTRRGKVVELSEFEREIIKSILCIEELELIISAQLYSKGDELQGVPGLRRNNINTNIGIFSSNVYRVEKTESSKINEYLRDMQINMITEIYRIKSLTRKDISKTFENDLEVLDYLLEFSRKIFYREHDKENLFESKKFITQFKNYFRTFHLKHNELRYFRVYTKYIPVSEHLSIMEESVSDYMNTYNTNLNHLMKLLILIYISDNYNEMNTAPLFIPLEYIMGFERFPISDTEKDNFIERLTKINVEEYNGLKYVQNPADITEWSFLNQSPMLFDLINRADKDTACLNIEPNIVFLDLEQINYPSPLVIPNVDVNHYWDYPYAPVGTCLANPGCINSIRDQIEEICGAIKAEKPKLTQNYVKDNAIEEAYRNLEEYKVFRNMFNSSSFLLLSGDMEYFEIIPRVIQRLYHVPNAPQIIYIKVNIVHDVSNVLTKLNIYGYKIWKFLMRDLTAPFGKGPINADKVYQLCFP